MVLLSLGPQALVALLHADKRPDNRVPDPFWLSSAAEPLVAAPFDTEQVSEFPQIFQSSN
jgi:hypothetical protein